MSRQRRTPAHAQGTEDDHPHGGLTRPETVTHASGKQHPSSADKPSRKNILTGQPLNQCEATRTSNGKRCRQTATKRTPEGWRCRLHRAPDPAQTLKPPVTVIKNKSDAERLASWITNQTALGHIKGANAIAALRGVAMWISAHKRMDAQLVVTFKELNAKAYELIKLLRAARLAWEDGDDMRAEDFEEQAQRTADEHDTLNADRRRLQAAARDED